MLADYGNILILSTSTCPIVNLIMVSTQYSDFEMRLKAYGFQGQI